MNITFLVIFSDYFFPAGKFKWLLTAPAHKITAPAQSSWSIAGSTSPLAGTEDNRKKVSEVNTSQGVAMVLRREAAGPRLNL